MEHCKRSGNEASPHTSGRQKNPRGPTKGSSSKGEILVAVAGRDKSSHPWEIRPVSSAFWNTESASAFWKRMSDVCDQYITRAKHTTEDQYVSLLSAISTAIQCQGWKVEQISFITGTRSVNKQDLSKNLKFFNVSEGRIQSIYSKLVTRVFDVYANILKWMYSTRFTGGPTRLEASPEAEPTPIVVTPLIRTMVTFHPDKYKKRKKDCQKEEDK
jgi:hypothetical protein